MLPPFFNTISRNLIPPSLFHFYSETHRHGFLPFQGLEVPLLVMQTKVFIVVSLQRFSPFLSKRTTFYRKVKSALRVGVSVHPKSPGRRRSTSMVQKELSTDKDDDGNDDDNNNIEVSSVEGESSSHGSTTRMHKIWDSSRQLGDTTQSAAMKLFTKIPFPEPRRVLNVQDRKSPLELLGVSQLGHTK